MDEVIQADEALEPVEMDEVEGEEIEEEVAMTDEEVLAICKEDLKTAKIAKVDIDDKIEKWRDMADGKELGNEVDGRSKFVSKESQKAISWWVPNAIKPFMQSNDIADFMPRTAEDMEIAKSQNVLINYQFNNNFQKYQFLHTSLNLFASEGTAVARLGWIHEEEEEIMPFEGLTEQQVSEIEAKGAVITIEDQEEVRVSPLDDPTGFMQTIYKGTATITKTTVSRPDAQPIRNEDFFIIGETIEDSDCCIQRIDTTREKLNKEGIYENVDQIVANSTEQRSSGLGTTRQEDLEDYGAVNPDEKQSGRDAITIYEYFGNIDRDKDGIAESIFCAWASDGTILAVKENPFPDGEPPFIGAPFMSIPFSFWGNGLPFYLEDVTKIKSAIMRTFIDLMANSTNGIKHTEKGALDALNMRKLKEAKIGDVIQWNDLGKYQPEVRNDIPSSLQQMHELFTAEGENESGVTRYNQGLDASSLNKTATGITAIMNQSQMRTWETVTRFAEQYMKPLFRKWIAYNQAFLDTSIAVRVAGDEYAAVSPDDIKGEFDLTVNVAIAGSEEQKAQKITGMLQMVTPLVQEGILPPNHITKLIAELEELSGFKDLAAELTAIAEAKADAKNQAVQGFLGLPEDAQVQIMQMAQQQMNPQGQGLGGGQPQMTPQRQGLGGGQPQ